MPPTVYYTADTQIRTSPDDQTATDAVKNLPDIMKWLSSWLPEQEVKDISSNYRTSFVDQMRRKFLESSLRILPQHRGLSGQGSAISLDLSRAENMLIQASLR